MNTQYFGLPATAVEKIRAVFARHPQVEKAVLYGSRAKGNHRNGSDIDLTLYGDRLSHRILLKIMGELDELLLPWMIDLSIFASLDHDKLIEHIERAGVIFYVRAERNARTE